MEQILRKTDFAERIAAKTEIPKKTVFLILDEFLEGIENALVEGERCQFTGFGVFEVKRRAPRTGHNPRNPLEVIEIPAKNVPVFRPGKILKEKVQAR